MIVAGTLDGRVLAFKPSGELLWEQALGAAVNDLAVADFGDRRVIAAALENYRVRVIEPGGVLGWEKQLSTSYTPESLRGATRVVAARNGNTGFDDIIVGTDGLDVYRLDRQGNSVWRKTGYHRGVHALAAADYDGDGHEQATVGMEWTIMHVEKNGQLVNISGGNGIVWRLLHVARFASEPRPLYLGGSANGWLRLADAATAKSRWGMKLDGMISAIATARDAANADIILAGTEGTHLRALRPNGNTLWRRRLTDRADSVLSLTFDEAKGLLVGTADGRLWLVDTDGTILRHTKLDGPILDLVPPGEGTGSPAYAVTVRGTLWEIPTRNEVHTWLHYGR